MKRSELFRWPACLAAAGLLAASAFAGDSPPRRGDPRPPNPAPAEALPDFRPFSDSADAPMLRLAPSRYADGVEEPSGADRPNPRTISNIVMAEPEAIPTQRGASSFLWQWGQFLDHDIDLTESTADEPFPISIPAGDPDFDPNSTGAVSLFLLRSIYAPNSGVDPTNPREQLNSITALIDASNVYGSDTERASALRTNDGTGRLRISEGNLLPFNTDGLANGGGPDAGLFVAGDVRANEQVGLTALHTLFLREHNRLADLIRAQDPGLTGEQVYQYARRMVGAEMQAITFREFLPALLGPDAIGPYRGYRPEVDPSIANLFATAAYRLGHSMLNERLLRTGADGREIPSGHLDLKDAFFFPATRLQSEDGIEPILRGLARQRARRIDPFLTDAVRNFLFGAPGEGGFDLAALNIQRGRDHGFADYNSVREALGMHRKNSFAAISSIPDIQRRLESAYGNVDRIDPWVGGLAEDPVRGALVGELFFEIVRDQFLRLRDGDPFWYERSLAPALVRQVEQLRLGDIIRLNTSIGNELPRDVFLAPPNAPF